MDHALGWKFNLPLPVGLCLRRNSWNLSKEDTNRTVSLFNCTLIHVDLAYILHVRWSYCGSRTLGNNFHFLSVFNVSEKKFMVQGEDKLKGSAQANLERNRQKLNEKNRPFPIWRRALARKNSYFDKIAELSVSEPQDAHESLEIEGFVAMGSFVERSHPHCRLCCSSGLELPLASKACSRLALVYVMGRINKKKTQRRASLTREDKQKSDFDGKWLSCCWQT